MIRRRPSARGPRAPGRRQFPRLSARLSPVRAAALLGLLLSGGSIYGVRASPEFALGDVTMSGLRYTDPVAVRALLPVDDGTNLFSLSVESLADGLGALPAVASAQVEVALPDHLVVTIQERAPIIIWQVEERRYLVDRTGLLFAPAPAAATGAAPSAAASLPVVIDRRISSLAALDVGDALGPVVLDAATRLASLRPIDVGSSATTLVVEVGDPSGFVVRATSPDWVAIFGFYTPSLRTTDLIPGQVRLLRSLLADRENVVDRIVLADETNGTYLPKVTPKPTAAPTPTPKPPATPKATPKASATTRP